MNFDLSEDQKMLAEQARKLLEESSSPDRLRQLIDDNSPYDQTLWKNLAELGFLGAAIPEEFGGVGMSAMELAVIAEEIGRFNAAIPFNSSIVQAAKAIELAGDHSQKESWLPRIATGEVIATLATLETPGVFSFKNSQCHFNNGKLSGKKIAVANGVFADLAIVSCLHNNQPALAIIKLEQPNIERKAISSFDELHPFAELQFDNANAELLTNKNAQETLQHVEQYAAAIIAFEQIGGSEACLYMARDYALERKIFGRNLASYQAIKHKLADIYVKIEIARSNAMYATWALVNDSVDKESATAVSRLSALNAFETAARENLQTHGGIGYTFEANCHFYYRRERLLATLLGGKSYWSNVLINSTVNA